MILVSYFGWVSCSAFDYYRIYILEETLLEGSYNICFGKTFTKRYFLEMIFDFDFTFYTAHSAGQKSCVYMQQLGGSGMPNGPIRMKQVN